MSGDGAPSRPALLILTICLLVVGALFVQTLWFGFVSWDDPHYLLSNPLVVGGTDAISWLDHLLTPRLGYPMPVTVLSYRIEHALFGLNPLPYHLTNVALHLVNCLLVFLLARRLGLDPIGSAAALLLFGLHPTVAEPVAWVTGRKDLLALLFSLLTVIDSLRHPFTPSQPRTWVFVIPFVLAVFSKTTALYLVVILPLLQLLVLGRSVSQVLITAVPLVAVALFVFPVAMLYHARIHGIRPFPGVLTLLRQAWFTLGFHVSLLLLVRTPCAKHVPDPWPPPFDPLVDLLPLLLAGSLVVLWRAFPAQQRRIAWAAAWWAVLTYLPSSSLIPLTRFASDTYLYGPLVGLGILVGLGADRMARRRVGLAVGCLILGAISLLLLAYPATAKYENSYTLWSQAYEQYPHDYRLCRNSANSLFQLEQHDQALKHYQDCANRFGPAAFEKNMAVTLFELGRHEEAKKMFLRAAARRPGDPVIQKYLKQLRRSQVNAPRCAP